MDMSKEKSDLELVPSVTDPSDRKSMDGTINLNDDLAAPSEHSYNSYTTHQPGNRKTGSVVSYRNSMDGDSSFSSSAYFQVFNNNDNLEDRPRSKNDSLSPLGPNSIFELTVASDIARTRHGKTSRNTVTINGGLTSVSNLRTPSLKDIPQIQLSKLSRRVDNKELNEKYLKDSADEYKIFESSYKSLTEDTLNMLKEQDKDTSGLLSKTSSIQDYIDAVDEDEGYENMDSIPSIFKGEEFKLDDPRIFKEVIRNSRIIPDEIGNEAGEVHILSNSDIQEKLSHYLDVVEVNLIKEIEKSSDSFFSTVGDIKRIEEGSKSCVDIFDSIMTKLNKLELDVSQKGIDILTKVKEKRNVEHLENALIQLKYIMIYFDLANKSLSNNNYFKCLNEIIVTESLIEGVSKDLLNDDKVYKIYPHFKFPILNLSELPGLINVINDLQKLKFECSKGYIEDFSGLLIDDLNTHCESVPLQDSINRMSQSMKNSKKSQVTVNYSYKSIEQSKKDRLKSYISNLARAKQLSQSFKSYQEKAIGEIKETIRKNLPNKKLNLLSSPDVSSSSLDVAGNQSSSQQANNSLSTSIKSLSGKEFESVFTKIVATLSECLRRLSVHQKVLLDLALDSTTQSSDIDVMSFDITITINKAIELTQVRLMKIHNVRSEQTADLNIKDYLRLYAITLAYLQECELINPGYGASMSGNTLGEWYKHHIGFFVHRFRANASKALIINCDKEIWKELTDTKEIADHQKIIDELLGYETFVTSSGKNGFSGEAWLDSFNLMENAETEETHDVGPDEVSTSRLQVTDKFLVPRLCLLSLHHIRDYITILKAFPSTSSVVELGLLNYMNLLNMRTSHAVLNAGATRTAGLKHIYTKHLALCIQFIEFNIELLEHLQNIFPTKNQEKTNGSNDEINFGKVLSNFKEHDTELCSKLVSIMYDHTVKHCDSMKAVDWSEPIKHPKRCHSYMETLVKETLSIHKQLSKYLSEVKCSLILSQIFDNYKKLLVECFCSTLPQFSDVNEKYSALKDIDYYRAELGELPGYGVSGQVIWENVNSLPTLEDAKMDNIMKQNIQHEIENDKSATNSAKTSVEVSSSPADGEYTDNPQN